ncbi:MAG: hypothetical protein ACTSW1_12760 [Candidatus Hodarchaeales archaeon]
MIENQTFIMIPSFEIIGKKRSISTQKGYFEISKNKIEYRYAGTKVDFIILNPTYAYGKINELPPYFDSDYLDIFYAICTDISEVCFHSGNLQASDLLTEFLFGDTLPFSIRKYESWFFNLRKIPSNIYEELYKSSMELEDTMATTIETFNENVYIPFKQQVIAAFSTNGENKDDKSSVALDIVSKDFPRFLGLQNDLITILRSQTKRTSDNQQLAYSVISPILRKLRMLIILRKQLQIKGQKNRLEIEVKPITLDSSTIGKKLEVLFS